MGLFGDSGEEKREEVTLGISEDDEDRSEVGADVRDVDLDLDGSEASSEEDSRLREQVEQEVGVASTGSSGVDDSGNDIDLEDVYEQNEEIKRKLDAIMSGL